MHTAQTWLPGYHAIRKFSFAFSLALLAGGACSQKALAQHDAALLANLTPYSITEPAFLKATCSGGLCRMPFPPVPAGKRLLITNVSLNTFSSSNYLRAVLTNGVTDYSAGDYSQMNLPGATIGKNDSTGFGYELHWSGLTTFYIEAGFSPTFVYYGSPLTNETAGEGSITGVLIPAR